MIYFWQSIDIRFLINGLSQFHDEANQTGQSNYHPNSSFYKLLLIPNLRSFFCRMQRNFSLFNGFIGLSKAMRMRNVMIKDFHASSITSQSGGEKRIEDLLKSKLKINEMVVRDISGGCGSMYEIYIVSDDFKGKRTVQQHRLINEILKEEVKQMHGLRIHTRIPE